MFRHYRVSLRELVINTLPRYASISNAAVGNKFTIVNIPNAVVGNTVYNCKPSPSENSFAVNNNNNNNNSVRIAQSV
jgi:asparagine N-glycosylation enzyme membrane subunit Stt3